MLSLCVCISHSHILDQGMAQTCTDVFNKLSFQVNNDKKGVTFYCYSLFHDLLMWTPEQLPQHSGSRSWPVRTEWAH